MSGDVMRDRDELGMQPWRLRLGTRRSALALTQSQWVADRLTKALADQGRQLEVELVEVTTHGDVSSAPLATLGGTGVFVSALRTELLAGRIDVAVHSLKDLPTAPAEGLVTGAVPAREDPRDVLVARDGLSLAELPRGSRIGTGSPRRAAQLRALDLGLDVVDVRGNVDTRLRMVTDGRLDGVVLARAGLLRLGRAGEATEVFDPLLMLPAPGQGALAVECRAADQETREALALIDDDAARASVAAERALLRRLEAGCAAPVGALAEVVEGEEGPELSLRAVVAAVDGTASLRRSAVAPMGRPTLITAPSDGESTVESEPKAPPDPGISGASRALPPVAGEATAEALGQALAEQLLEDGAGDLMPAATSTQAREGDT